MQKVKLPKTVDPKRAAQQRSEFSGIYEVKELKRLALSCVSVNSDADVNVSFDIDSQGRIFFKGQVSSQVTLECQRCGQNFDYDISTQFCFSPAKDEKQDDEDQLPEAYDPIELDPSGELDLLSVVEDELILMLPVVPKHQAQDCSAASEKMSWGEIEEEAEKPNPFAILSQLKK